MIYDWPPALLAQQIAFDQRGMTIAGPASLATAGQVGSLDAGFWIAFYAFSTLDMGSDIKLFRSLRAKLQGGAHQVRVPVVDSGQAPWPLSGGLPVTSVASTKFTDGTHFTDGTGFLEWSISIALAADAALRSTNISATVTTAGVIVGGELFSIDDRLYIIQEVRDDGSWVIWPPLRKAVVAGTPLNFDAPVCRMRLASESEMALLMAGMWRSDPTAAFVEETRGN